MKRMYVAVNVADGWDAADVANAIEYAIQAEHELDVTVWDSESDVIADLKEGNL